MRPPSYMWSVVDRNVVMRHMTVMYTDLQTPLVMVQVSMHWRRLESTGHQKVIVTDQLKWCHKRPLALDYRPYSNRIP